MDTVTQAKPIQAADLAFGPNPELANSSFSFDGDAGSYLGVGILAALLTGITLGVGVPWALCMRERWKAEHTSIGGKRLKFVGTGGDLFGKWIGWFCLTVITAGIYGFWVGPKLIKWRVEHTQFN